MKGLIVSRVIIAFALLLAGSGTGGVGAGRAAATGVASRIQTCNRNRRGDSRASREIQSTIAYCSRLGESPMARQDVRRVCKDRIQGKR